MSGPTFLLSSFSPHLSLPFSASPPSSSILYLLRHLPSLLLPSPSFPHLPPPPSLPPLLTWPPAFSWEESWGKEQGSPPARLGRGHLPRLENGEPRGTPHFTCPSPLPLCCDLGPPRTMKSAAVLEPQPQHGSPGSCNTGLPDAPRTALGLGRSPCQELPASPFMKIPDLCPYQVSFRPHPLPASPLSLSSPTSEARRWEEPRPRSRQPDRGALGGPGPLAPTEDCHLSCRARKPSATPAPMALQQGSAFSTWQGSGSFCAQGPRLSVTGQSSYSTWGQGHDKGRPEPRHICSDSHLCQRVPWQPWRGFSLPQDSPWLSGNLGEGS